MGISSAEETEKETLEDEMQIEMCRWIKWSWEAGAQNIYGRELWRKTNPPSLKTDTVERRPN